MNTPTVQGFFDDTTNTISYVVWDPATEKAAVIGGHASGGRVGKIAPRVEGRIVQLGS